MSIRISVGEAPLVLLAGGRSERMGTLKGLLNVGAYAAGGDCPLLTWQLERFRAAGGRRVVVVLGHREAEYRAALSYLKPGSGLTEFIRGLRLETVINKQPEVGPFSSVCAGLGALMRLEAPAAFYIMPIDVPAPSHTVWSELALAMQGGVQAVVPTYSGRGGHPVLIQRAFAERLLTLPVSGADSRLDVQLHQLAASQLKRLPCDDPSILINLNEPADWHSYQQALATRGT